MRRCEHDVGLSLGPVIGVVVGDIDGSVGDRELEVATADGVELDDAVHLRWPKPNLELGLVLTDKARPIDAAGQLGPADRYRAGVGVQIVARVVYEAVSERFGRTPDCLGIGITCWITAFTVQRINRGWRFFAPGIAITSVGIDIVRWTAGQDCQAKHEGHMKSHRFDFYALRDTRTSEIDDWLCLIVGPT